MALTTRQSIDHYIGPDPDHQGAQYAILRAEGVPVAALIGYLIGVGGDVQRVADDYMLSKDAVEAAVVYYHQHKTAMDAFIAPTLAFHNL